MLLVSSRSFAQPAAFDARSRPKQTRGKSVHHTLTSLGLHPERPRCNTNRSRFRCHEDLAEIGACAHTNERQRGYLKMQGIVSREHTNVLVMTLGSRKLKTFSCLIDLLGDITHSLCGMEFTELNANEDQSQTSTALGYICHFMVIASKYLQITLRYSPCYKVSRSLIRNPLTRSDSDSGWPLHRKETERRHYEQAVNYLISGNVLQASLYLE